jgi:nucleotide-binding universal stress UspA family protein
MIALKRILVATDFSESSSAALKYGIALARAFGARLHVLHAAGRHDLEVMVERQLVIDKFLQDPSSADVHHNAARELMGELLTAEEHEVVQAEFVLRACGQAGPWAEIVRYARERDLDLIIVGTHGRGMLGHLLVGSVAEKVVRTAPCPVLTVRHPQHEFVLP